MKIISLRQKRLLSILGLSLILAPQTLLAQNLDSTNYRLVQPTVEPISEINESTNYKILNNSSQVNSFTTYSSTYRSRGGTATFIEANVPTVSCFETITTGVTTTCTGTPQASGNGMQSVCALPGCYDRAKLEINTEGNPDDTQYAIQISKSADFSTNNFYIDGTTHLPKTSLTINDFLFKCEWEGTALTGYCAATNATWQKFNIIGLWSNTTYYARLSALHGSDSDGNFTQSQWSPAVSVATTTPSITFNIDIASNVSGTSTAPYRITLPELTSGVINTSNDYIIFRLSTNARTGASLRGTGLNGALENTSTSDTIDSVNGDLAVLTSGYGIRNDVTTNSQVTNSYLGSVRVSNSPSDFTDAGAANKVGEIPITFVEVFDSTDLPLLTGVSAYKVKVKLGSQPRGNYQETLTFVAVGEF
jgi:hypothetical protein